MENIAGRRHLISQNVKMVPEQRLGSANHTDDANVVGGQTNADFRFCLKKKYLGIPITSLQIRNCYFDILTLSPNWITILAAAILAGQHVMTWDGSFAQKLFKHNWEEFGAGFVGSLGMPSILLGCVIITSPGHGAYCLPILKFTSARENADIANLLYLGKALRTNTLPTFNRAVFIFIFKNLKLWAKVSLAAVTWNESSAFKHCTVSFLNVDKNRRHPEKSYLFLKNSRHPEIAIYFSITQARTQNSQTA